MDAQRMSKYRRLDFAIVSPGLVALVVGWLVLSQSEIAVRAQAPEPEQSKAPAAAGEDAPKTESLEALRKRLLAGGFGPKTSTERAVVAALYWLSKHQMANGSWSLEKYTQKCKDKSCTGVGSIESLSAATGLGLLPFLAAGQTQSTNGPFQMTIRGGVNWLMSHQKADGDLSADAASQMYSHGLATIALCEDYGRTHDKSVGIAAQKAIDFIQDAQNSKTGGWRYHPGEEGDTSVLGWQLAALNSAGSAGLSVKPSAFDGAKKWLKSCSAEGADLGMFSYQPEGGPTPTMTAVGILSNQRLHVDRTDPVVAGGVKYLMANQPDAARHNVYYWYHATEVMRNMADKDWDTWNRKMRKILVESQTREGCAAGSWDPEKPDKDAWGPIGGRIMMTSLSCLTLEIHIRAWDFLRTNDRNDAPK